MWRQTETKAMSGRGSIIRKTPAVKNVANFWPLGREIAAFGSDLLSMKCTLITVNQR